MHFSGWFTQAVIENAVGPKIVKREDPSDDEEEKGNKRAQKEAKPARERKPRAPAKGKKEHPE